MAVTIYEEVSSRALMVDSTTAKLTIKYIAMGSDDHAAVYAAVLLYSPRIYFSLLRLSIGPLDFRGGGVCFVSV